MKTTKHVIAALVLASLSFVYCAQAADLTTTNGDDNAIAYPHFQDQELSLDVFGSGSISRETLDNLSGISGSQLRRHSLWGGGGGLTYYFLRYVGVGGDFDAETRSSRFVDNAAGNVYFRLPIADLVAPYVFGGGGYEFQDVRQAFGDAGAGLEIRFCRHLGIFADGRYVFTAHTEDYAEARAGVRITF